MLRSGGGVLKSAPMLLTPDELDAMSKVCPLAAETTHIYPAQNGFFGDTSATFYVGRPSDDARKVGGGAPVPRDRRASGATWRPLGGPWRGDSGLRESWRVLARHHRAHQILGDIALAADRCDKALEHYRAPIQRRPTAVSETQLARATECAVARD